MISKEQCQTLDRIAEKAIIEVRAAGEVVYYGPLFEDEGDDMLDAIADRLEEHLLAGKDVDIHLTFRAADGMADG